LAEQFRVSLAVIGLQKLLLKIGRIGSRHAGERTIATPSLLFISVVHSNYENALVSGNYFAVLGIQPLIGYLLAASDDDLPMSYPVVVPSHALWRDRFSSDPHIIGAAMRINHYPFTVMGVAPPSFASVQPGSAPQLWAP
jgi:MacB-like periplasmic core domain